MFSRNSLLFLQSFEETWTLYIVKSFDDMKLWQKSQSLNPAKGENSLIFYTALVIDERSIHVLTSMNQMLSNRSVKSLFSSVTRFLWILDKYTFRRLFQTKKYVNWIYKWKKKQQMISIVVYIIICLRNSNFHALSYTI